MLGRGGSVGKAQRLFERGAVEDAASLLREERKKAADDNDADRLAEIDEISSEMRERLEGDDRLPGFDAHLSEAAPAEADQAEEDEAVDVTPLSLGIALVGAGLMLIAVFLRQFEANAFAQIEKNSLIQNGDGWWFILLTVLSAGAAYRAYHQQRRTFAPVVFGLIGIALAIYYGTSHSQRRLCSVASGGNCTLATPGIGIYAAGIGAFLVAVGGWQIFRAQRVEVEYEDEDETAEPQRAGTAPASIADRLRTLDQLRADGLITDIEHSERRAALLEQV